MKYPGGLPPKVPFHGYDYGPTAWSICDDREARQTERTPVVSDGSTASYYELPEGAKELQHLISHRDMNAQVGEIFRACYRYGLVEHSPCKRDIKKILFYAQAELDRLEALDVATPPA
jgi:hypothetical protein